MGLAELGAFVEAASRGSVTAAARALGLPKSTVSRRIRRLEGELGRPLVERGVRRLRLTDAGELLYRRSASAVRDLDEAARSVRDGAIEPAGELRITAPRDIGASAPLVQLFVGFREAHPQVRLTVDLNDRLVDILAEGFDFAIRLHERPLEELTHVRIRRLGNVAGALFASRSYLDRSGRPAHPPDLLAHRCLVTAPGAVTGPWELRWQEQGVVAAISPEPGLLTNSTTFVREAIAAGAGIGALPTFVGAELVRAGGVERVLPGWSLPAGTLSLLWPARRHQVPRLRAYLDYLASGFAQACASD